MIRTEWNKDFSVLLSKTYLELYQSLPTHLKNYFNHPKFSFVCLKVFNKVEPCFLFSVFKENKLIGYATFRKTKLMLRGIKIDCLVPGGFKIAEYNMPVISPGNYREFFNGLDTATSGQSFFYHNCSGFYTEWFRKEVKNSFIYSITSNPIMNDIGNAIFKASQKKDGVRYYKVLKKETNFEVQHYTANITEELLNEFFSLHIKRWESEGINSKFKDEVYRDIYLALVQLSITEYGVPVLNCMKSDDKYLAMHFGFIINNSFLYQIPAFNIDQKSSGTVLLKSIFDYMVEKKLSIFDMGYGLEDYKFRYMNDIVNYFTVVRFSNSILNSFYKIRI